ncbi:MrcB family domain-containing protein [Segetibacter aerophilus]|uniref:AAA+ ATPase domain-containing protein n=1 Tax=Segetibacter aerophilus TaxID=670293 RepID=A0A512BGA0_9BACT|nr:DUF3578 domain-containing protein [Segetibacter aerophilus]GEO10983.1 hypothetical protein SAE01_34790 [Segetibacter aerophilus]
MPIPKNITREHLLAAIDKIDKEGTPPGGESRYYDVVYNKKRYPPKVIVSFANLFANEEILDRNSFEGGKDTDCFNLLQENGFEIVNKAGSIIEKIKAFSENYKQEVQLKHSSNLVSFQLLVKEIPEELRKHVETFDDKLTIKGSIGSGVNTYYPWIGIFDPRVSTGATNGFYVVILFSDDFEDCYLTLNQGATLQTEEQTEAYRDFIYSVYENIEGFVKGRIPEGGLVRTQTGKASANGKKYEEKNIFYRKYKVSSLLDEDLLKNLERLVDIYIDCADKYSKTTKTTSRVMPSTSQELVFDCQKFHADISSSGLRFNKSMVIRFVSSLLTKPFVILTGLSGSGKTKLAQAFARWICQNENQYCIVPVGADWINREPLLGYPNSLEFEKYVKPDNGILDLIMDASIESNQQKPYFLILDEMNLSHVERYFADFLSVMESQDRKGILLHSDKNRTDTSDTAIPNSIKLPANLFIIGTVNIDETTYMFSPKVLDRANVIEFRVTNREMETFLEATRKISLDSLEARGATMASSFISLATNDDLKVALTTKEELTKPLLKFFDELKKIGAEFGYRSASEIFRFVAVVETLQTGWKPDQMIDAAIMQKLLPKLHGSRSKLVKVLITLGQLCLKNDKDVKKEVFDKHHEFKFEENDNVHYPISLEKISRMHKNVVEHGFTSYAEA